MAEVVSSQPLNAEAQVHAWVSPSEICGGQVALGQVFLGILWFSPSLSFHSGSLWDEVGDGGCS
jgi:hypothetical protein